MTIINYISPDGTQTTIDARDGDSVMETAVKNGVQGIVAECGGACACATCHVYVDEKFSDLCDAPSDLEDDMLDGTAAERLNNSRLSCQLKVRAET
jgi:2Fe-2S ferredoxin